MTRSWKTFDFNFFLKTLGSMIKNSVSSSSTEISRFLPSSFHISLCLTSIDLFKSSADFLGSISWSNQDIRRDRGNSVKFFVAWQVEFCFNYGPENF